MGKATFDSKPATPIGQMDHKQQLKDLVQPNHETMTPLKTVTFGHGQPQIIPKPWINELGEF